MEELDRRIVEHLARDGRMSYTDLGKSLGMSTSAVHQRVRRLEQRGIITGYAARINHASIGPTLTAFMSLLPIDPSDPDDIPDRLREISEIEECHSVAGDMSYVLKVRVESPTQLEDLIARVRAAANVTTRTTVVLSTPWE